MKRIFWLVFFLAISLSMQAASWVEGEVYLKDGTVVRFEQKDRIRLPKGRQALKAFRNAFYKTKQKESFAFDQIDSLVCWHPKEKGYPRKYIPVSSTGWCWVYMETPHISVWVYSKKGFFHGSRRRHRSAVSQQDGFRTFKGLVLSGKERQWRGLSPWFGSKIPGGQDVSRADLSLHRGRSLVVPHDPRHGGSFAQRPHFDLGRLSSFRKGTTEQLNNLP